VCERDRGRHRVVSVGVSGMAAAVAAATSAADGRRALLAKERAALVRLGWFTTALVFAPWVTYRWTRRTVCVRAYEVYGTAMLATESGRATCAGMFAIMTVNVVLLAYVAFALSLDRGDSEKKDD
jgi:hypothetical protein